MLPDEKHELLAALAAGREALTHSLEGVDEALASHQPSPDSWSIRDCVEHVALAEQFLLSRLAAAALSDAPPDTRKREPLLMKGALNRARKAQSPEPASPAGRFATLHEALAAFDAARAQTLQVLEKFTGDPRCWLTTHPLVPGTVNCYEILLLAAVHPARHAQQIAEIRTLLRP